MTKANAGSLLVFDASKLDLGSASEVTPPGDAVEGIVTERGRFRLWPRMCVWECVHDGDRGGGEGGEVTFVCIPT